MDAISRMPGNGGEDSDAVGAYTQVSLADAAKILGEDVVTATWISLPSHRRPKSWENIKDPVCPLILNLYRHPLAGLLWEKYQEMFCLKSAGKRFNLGNAFTFIEPSNFFCHATSMTIKWHVSKKTLHPCGNASERKA